MAYVSGNKQSIFRLPHRHCNGVEATVFGISNFRIILWKSGDVLTACRKSGQDDIDQFGRETELFPGEDCAILGKNFFIYQGNGLPFEHGKKNLPGLEREFNRAETSTFVSITA